MQIFHNLDWKNWFTVLKRSTGFSFQLKQVDFLQSSLVIHLQANSWMINGPPIHLFSTYTYTFIIFWVFFSPTCLFGLHACSVTQSIVWRDYFLLRGLYNIKHFRMFKDLAINLYAVCNQTNLQAQRNISRNTME